MAIREVKGTIQKIHLIAPKNYYFFDAIFQIEVESEEEWSVQLMFKTHQILLIMNEFDVRFANDLCLKECYLLDTNDFFDVPLAIKNGKDGNYIPTGNNYFDSLLKE